MRIVLRYLLANKSIYQSKQFIYLVTQLFAEKKENAKREYYKVLIATVFPRPVMRNVYLNQCQAKCAKCFANLCAVLNVNRVSFGM